LLGSFSQRCFPIIITERFRKLSAWSGADLKKFRDSSCKVVWYKECYHD
jgi:hypothetical protein